MANAVDVCPLGNEWLLLKSGRSSFIAYFNIREAPTEVTAVRAPCLRPFQSFSTRIPVSAATGIATTTTSVETPTPFCDDVLLKLSSPITGNEENTNNATLAIISLINLIAFPEIEVIQSSIYVYTRQHSDSINK